MSLMSLVQCHILWIKSRYSLTDISSKGLFASAARSEQKDESN